MLNLNEDRGAIVLLWYELTGMVDVPATLTLTAGWN